MVIAVPLPPVVERDDEQVGVFEIVERLLAGGWRHLAQDGVTQRAGHAVQNRSPQQEGLNAFGLALKDLFDQIIQDVVLAAGEGRQEAGNIFTPPHGERRQLQPGDPPLGAALQSGDVFGRQAQAHHLVEERGRFVRRKAQVGGAQFHQLATRAQAGKRKWRIDPAGNDQVHGRRQVVKQKRDRVVDRLRLDDVVIVEDEDKILWDGRHRVDQAGQEHLNWRHGR